MKKTTLALFLLVFTLFISCESPLTPPSNYTVAFLPNNGLGVMDELIVTAGSSIDLPKNKFTRVGFSFKGWSTNEKGPVEYANESNFTMGSANVKLYAIWSKSPTHTVTFDGNGATSGTMNTQSLVEGVATTLKGNEYLRDGFSFVGWSTNAAGPVEYQNEHLFTIGSTDITLYAIWSNKPSYTVTFDGNGATNGSMNTQSIVEGVATPLLINNYQRIGYSFAGWSTNTTGTVEYTNESLFTIGSADVTLYAIWSDNPLFSVTFKGNGSTNGTMSTQRIVEGVATPLKSNEYFRNGYTFIGWSTNSEGPVEYENDSLFTIGSADVTLFAIWRQNPTYSVTFNGNGATSGSMSTQNIIEGMATALISNEFYRDGYTFTGWSSNTTGSAEYANESNFTIGNSNVTLYAIWDINPSYTVTFDGNGASGSCVFQSLVQGLPTSLNSNPFSRDGFTFAGWSTTRSGLVEYADGAEFKIGSSSIVLYARWTPEIGTTYEGGIVFYVDDTLVHGLVCTPIDLNNKYPVKWDNGEQIETGATSIAIGTGSENTKLIIAAQGKGSYAAKLCNDLYYDDYNDWFLPSRDELIEIYKKLKLNDIGGPYYKYYWSSSEIDQNSAWGYNFIDGIGADNTKATFGIARVRAIRSF